MHRGCCGGLVLALVLGQTTAWGDQRSPTFSVDYAAPIGCPTRSMFTEGIRSRVPGAVEVASGEANVDFRVQLEPTASAIAGTLVIRLPDGREFERPIPPSSCEEVAASMTVIAAMVLDGRDGSLEAAKPATKAVNRDSSGERKPEPMRAPIASQRAAAASLASSRREPTTRTASGETDVASQNAMLPVALAFALDGGLQTGVAPDPSWALSTGIDVAFGRDASAAPSARLRGTFASSSTEATAYGDAQFRLIGAELSGCARRFPGARVGVRPCALVQAGDLRGKGENTIDRKVRHMPWLGFGASLRFEVSASSRFGLELEASGTRLLRSDRFVFEPELVVHTVPEWAFGVRAGPVMRFF